jgi:hypothetical protein
VFFYGLDAVHCTKSELDFDGADRL